MFEDVQISGPFHKWRHQHLILPHESGAILRDEIEYEPPFWIFGKSPRRSPSCQNSKKCLLIATKSRENGVNLKFEI